MSAKTATIGSRDKRVNPSCIWHVAVTSEGSVILHEAYLFIQSETIVLLEESRTLMRPDQISAETYMLSIWKSMA